MFSIVVATFRLSYFILDDAPQVLAVGVLLGGLARPARLLAMRKLYAAAALCSTLFSLRVACRLVCFLFLAIEFIQRELLDFLFQVTLNVELLLRVRQIRRLVQEIYLDYFVLVEDFKR